MPKSPQRNHPRANGSFGVGSPELLAVLLVFTVFNVLGGFFQQNIDVNHGLGWDGEEYHHYAQQIARHEPVRGYEPRIGRLGTCFLAAFSGSQDLKTGFLVVNLEANLLIVVLLELWLSFWIWDRKIRILLNVLFQANWLGPVRFVWFYPILTDHWALVWFLLGSMIAVRYRDSWPGIMGVALISFIGSFFRETILILPLAYLFLGAEKETSITSFFKGVPARAFPIFCFVMGRILLSSSVGLVDDFPPGNFAGRTHPFDIFEEMRLHLTGLDPWRYLLSWFTAYGVVLFIPLMGLPGSLAFLWKDAFLSVSAATYLVLSTLGGTDWERYFIWFSPWVLLWVGSAMEQGLVILQRGWGVALFVILQILSLRLFWTTPAQNALPLAGDIHSFLTSWGEPLNYTCLLSFYAPWTLVRARLLQYLVLGTLLWAVEHYLRQRPGPRTGRSARRAVRGR